MSVHAHQGVYSDLPAPLQESRIIFRNLDGHIHGIQRESRNGFFGEMLILYFVKPSGHSLLMALNAGGTALDIRRACQTGRMSHGARAHDPVIPFACLVENLSPLVLSVE